MVLPDRRRKAWETQSEFVARDPRYLKLSLRVLISPKTSAGLAFCMPSRSRTAGSSTRRNGLVRFSRPMVVGKRRLARGPELVDLARPEDQVGCSPARW